MATDEEVKARITSLKNNRIPYMSKFKMFAYRGKTTNPLVFQNGGKKNIRIEKHYISN